MNLIQLILSAILICILPGSNLHASSYLKSLKDASTHDFAKLTKIPSLVVIFKDDCLSCSKQIKDLRCIDRDVQILLLGTSSSESKLKRYLNRTRNSYPAYMGSKEVIKKLTTNSNLTPQTFYLSGNSKTKFVGYHSCEKIKKSIQLLDL